MRKATATARRMGMVRKKVTTKAVHLLQLDHLDS